MIPKYNVFVDFLYFFQWYYFHYFYAYILEIRKGLLNEIEIFFLAIELSKNKQKRKYLYCQFLRKQHAIVILLFDKWEKSEKNGRT